MTISKTSFVYLRYTTFALLYIFWVFPYRLVRSKKKARAPWYKSCGPILHGLSKAMKASLILVQLVMVVYMILAIVLVPGLSPTETLQTIAVCSFICMAVDAVCRFFIESQLQHLRLFFNGMYTFNRKLGKLVGTGSHLSFDFFKKDLAIVIANLIF